ncbi:MAG: hypothetical protein ACI9R3_003468 [Verrucomicrobiales bacterium]|jgi:hypothetical protein
MVSTATPTDVLFQCPSCGTEMCVAAEYLTVSGPCICCANVTSAQQALIHAAQQRLMASMPDAPEEEFSSEAFNRGTSAMVEPESDDSLLTNNFETGDSWLLPNPVEVTPSAPETVSFQDTAGAFQTAGPTAEPIAEDPDFEPWLEAPSPAFENAVPKPEHEPTLSLAPRGAGAASFGELSLIDTDFLGDQSGTTKLPPTRGQGPPRSKHEDADSPFVPNRVIAATGEADSSWKEKHRRKSRGHRRRRSAEKKVDRFADNSNWKVIRGVLSIAAVVVLFSTLIFGYKTDWGDSDNLDRVSAEREQRDLLLERSANELIPEQALSVDRSVNRDPLADLDTPDADSQGEFSGFSENLDYGN